jgi:GNAT superfamily N-acetyltransferase
VADDRPRGLVAYAGLDAEHRASVREVYESSFPAALRAPWAEITSSRPDEQLMVLLAEHDRGAPTVGLLLVRHLGDTSITFLRYFVVDAAHRGQGHGSALWTALVEHLRGYERSMLLLDVEDPDARAAGSPDRLDDERRIAFYRRHGAHLLAVRDYSPPDHGLAGEEPDLLLMGAHLHHDPSPAGPLGPPPAGADLRAAVEAVYRHRYGLAPDDPVVRATLTSSGLLPPGR